MMGPIWGPGKGSGGTVAYSEIRTVSPAASSSAVVCAKAADGANVLTTNQRSNPTVKRERRAWGLLHSKKKPSENNAQLLSMMPLELTQNLIDLDKADG